MQVRNLERDAEPFITADGSTIREILNVIHPPTAQQSLAEASLPALKAFLQPIASGGKQP